jgi:hypothetical protein
MKVFREISDSNWWYYENDELKENDQLIVARKMIEEGRKIFKIEEKRRKKNGTGKITRNKEFVRN